jgi:hypothetical protein
MCLELRNQANLILFNELLLLKDFQDVLIFQLCFFLLHFLNCPVVELPFLFLLEVEEEVVAEHI